ncbi:hypothetical protein ACMFMG_009549 [Clarireedia jacksonii]
MSNPNAKSQSKPMAIQFVSGRAKDRSTQSMIRSHAMSAFRSRQRQQRAQETGPILQNAGHEEASCESRPFDPSLAACGISTQIDNLTSVAQPSREHWSYSYDPFKTQPVFALQEIPSLLNFATVDLDPFSYMPELPPYVHSKYAQDVESIKKFALTFCSPGPIRTIAFPEAIRTPALLASILYMAYAYMCSVRGTYDSELALGLKTAAISYVNQRLSDPETAQCTSTIASIVYLFTGTWAFGCDVEELATHMIGIELLLKRQGMTSFGRYPFGQTIRKYLVLHHILVSAIRVEEPSVTFDDTLTSSTKTEDRSSQLVSPLYCPPGSFEAIGNLNGASNLLIQVLYIAKDLTDLIIEDYETAVEPAMFQSRLSIAQYALSSLPPHSSHQQYPFHYATTHLIASLLLHSLVTSTPLLSSPASLTRSLVQTISCTNISETWGDMLGLLYWVCMIGAAASQGRDSHGILDSTLGRTMFRMAFEVVDLEAAVEPARRFATLQLALGRRHERKVVEDLLRDMESGGPGEWID